MSAAVVIFAIGNPSRGDDALGPMLCGQLAAWLENQGLAADFELIEDFQLQIEHALDLQGPRLALFIDAALGVDAAFCFREIEPVTMPSHSTHALPPEAVLAVCHAMGVMPPPAFVLGVRAESFELGASLSARAAAAGEAAFASLTTLCRQAQLENWRQFAAGPISAMMPVSIAEC